MFADLTFLAQTGLGMSLLYITHSSISVVVMAIKECGLVGMRHPQYPCKDSKLGLVLRLQAVACTGLVHCQHLFLTGHNP